MPFTELVELIPSNANSEAYNVVGPVTTAVALDVANWTVVATFPIRDAKSAMLRFRITPNVGNLSGDDRIEWYLGYEDRTTAIMRPVPEVLESVVDAYGTVGIQAGLDHEEFIGAAQLYNYRYFTSSGGGGIGDEHEEVVPLVGLNGKYVNIYMRGRGRAAYANLAPTLSGLWYALSDEANEDLVTPRERKPVVSFNNSSNTVLGGGATFTGAEDKCLDGGSITLNAFADVDSALNGLQVHWYGVTGGLATETVDQFSLVANTPLSRTLRRKASRFHVTCLNGAGPQGAFALEVIINPWPAGDEVASATKGTTLAAGVTSEAIDANTQALDVNLAGAAGVAVDVHITEPLGQGAAAGAVRTTLADENIGPQATAANSTATTNNTPSAPTHGVTVALNNDNSTLVATVQVGYRYRITIIGGEGTVTTNSAGPAARATDDPVWPMQKFEIIAVHTSIYAQKLVAGTTNSSVNTCPLDGGTIA